jgi:hypothetical protein
MLSGLGARSALALVACFGLGHAAEAESSTPAAQAIFQIIDGMDVEHHWPAGQHIVWHSGVPDDRPEKGEGKHTHCSAFVAAAAEKLGIYVLRPPEHSQQLLANAQYDWLAAEGPGHGWRRVRDEIEAQHEANQGLLVLAVYKNHHDDKPGHIVIVRPGDSSAEVLREQGPQVTQAGGTNYRSVSLRTGFAGHPAAWQGHEILFYAHSVEPTAIRAAATR